VTTSIQASVFIISAKISCNLCFNAAVFRPLVVIQSIYVTFTNIKYLIIFIIYRKASNVAFNVSY
jgi:hypothetical protein